MQILRLSNHGPYRLPRGKRKLNIGYIRERFKLINFKALDMESCLYNLMQLPLKERIHLHQS